MFGFEGKAVILTISCILPWVLQATALALTAGQCDINSGDTYNTNLLAAVAGTGGATGPCVFFFGSVDHISLFIMSLTILDTGTFHFLF